MTVPEADMQQIEARLRPVIEATIQETLRAVFANRPGMTIQFGTIDSTDGPDAYIVMDDTPGETIQVTRSVGSHADGARVPVLFWPPSGSLVLPAVPDPA